MRLKSLTQFAFEFSATISGNPGPGGRWFRSSVRPKSASLADGLKYPDQPASQTVGYLLGPRAATGISISNNMVSGSGGGSFPILRLRVAGSERSASEMSKTRKTAFLSRLPSLTFSRSRRTRALRLLQRVRKRSTSTAGLFRDEAAAGRPAGGDSEFSEENVRRDDTADQAGGSPGDLGTFKGERCARLLVALF